MVTVPHPSAELFLSIQVSMSWMWLKASSVRWSQVHSPAVLCALPMPSSVSQWKPRLYIVKDRLPGSVVALPQHSTQAKSVPACRNTKVDYGPSMSSFWTRSHKLSFSCTGGAHYATGNRYRLWNLETDLTQEFVKEVKINKQLKLPLQKNRKNKWALLRLFSLCPFTHDIDVWNKHLFSKGVRANNLNLRFKGWGH